LRERFRCHWNCQNLWDALTAHHWLNSSAFSASASAQIRAVDVTTHLAAGKTPFAVAVVPILPRLVKGKADHDGDQEEGLRELPGEYLKSV
jgi:hypothetical protein